MIARRASHTTAFPPDDGVAGARLPLVDPSRETGARGGACGRPRGAVAWAPRTGADGCGTTIDCSHAGQFMVWPTNLSPTSSFCAQCGHAKVIVLVAVYR